MRLPTWVIILIMSALLPAGADTTSGTNISFEHELNTLRGRNGLPRVLPNEMLMAAALRHAEDMSRHRFISHTGSDGSLVDKRAQAEGFCFRHVNENIAKGYRQFDDVLDAWYLSPGHKRNLLSPEVSLFGFAKVNRAWVLVMAAPC